MLQQSCHALVGSDLPYPTHFSCGIKVIVGEYEKKRGGVKIDTTVFQAIKINYLFT
jgi:hypothetical protein